jgi:NAD(P)-dependent dehydrogenase (short-subunit alcohol dehydrogenase family)
MDPSEFGYSELEMKHAPYGPITSEALRDANAGKVAVVTGAAQGIGAAIAEALAKSGASVALLDLFAERLAKTKQACEQHGVGVRAYTCDVTDGDRVREILDAVEMELGHIDVLVNNAGILDQRPFIMADFDAFWRQVEVNFKAVCIASASLSNSAATSDKSVAVVILGPAYPSHRPAPCLGGLHG